MEQTELLTLIERCRAGDPEAQEKLVVETQNRVYYHCKKFLKNEEDAQDATQDVLIAMITGLDKLRQPAAFWGWLNGITANRCKHLLTQGTKEWQIPEDDEGNSMLDSIETLDDQTVPDKVMDNAETQRLVMDIIDALPAEQRMTVTFFYYDEMSVKDIAKAMDVSEGTVKSRLNYARKTIKVEVEKLEKKDGTKLYSVSVLPFLAYFFRKSAQGQTLPPAAAAAITQGALAGAGTTAGVAAGAGAASGAAGAGSAATTGATATAVGTKAAGAVAGTKAAVAGAVAAKTGLGLGAKLLVGALAGVLTLGGIGGGVYVATHWDELSARFGGGSDRTDEGPVAYYQAYAQKARELDGEGGEYRYDLFYIDEDDIPELAIQDAQDDTISIYTVDAKGRLRTVIAEKGKGYRDFDYYPKANVFARTSLGRKPASLTSAYQTVTQTYYHINDAGEAEEFYASTASPFEENAPNPRIVPPPEVEGLDKETILPALTAQELLDVLDRATAVSQTAIFAPTPTPSAPPTQGPASAYASAYAAKVRELQEELGDEARYNLLYINEDDVPELIVSVPASFAGQYNGESYRIYTFTPEGELRLVGEEAMGIRDSVEVYPRKNILYADSISGGTGMVYASCYRINEAYELERFFSGSGQWDPRSGDITWKDGEVPPLPEGETPRRLSASKKAQGILELLAQ